MQDDKMLEMHGDVKVIMSEVINIKKWMDKHQESDKENFGNIYEKVDATNKKVSGMYKYFGTIAAISAVIGFYVGKI